MLTYRPCLLHYTENTANRVNSPTKAAACSETSVWGSAYKSCAPFTHEATADRAMALSSGSTAAFLQRRL